MKSLPDFGLFLSLISLSIFLLILDSFGFLKYPKMGLSFLTSPIQYGFYKTSQNFGEQFQFLKNAKDLKLENQNLKKRLDKAFAENASLQKKVSELSALNSQITHLDPKTYKVLPARPIGLDRYLHIDKGEQDGVRVGQVVIFENNFVGKITKVSPRGASITLITDPNTKISAFSQNLEGKAKGIILGQFGSQLLFDKILQEENIKKEDLVYTDGLEEFIPRGLILGQVISTSEKSSEVFKQAKVNLNFEIRDLELVFIILE